MKTPGRWAIYYAPPENHTLWQLGCAWLQRTGDNTTVPPAGLDMTEWRHITAAPRRYGLHATLKAPMRLAPGAQVASLRQRLADIAKRHAAFTLPTLEIDTLGGFLALRPNRPCNRLDSLAKTCVIEGDRFRAPLDEQDLARRRRHSLDTRQTELLKTWGYPYVFEQYQFHLSLTGRLDSAALRRIQPALTRWFAPALAEPVPIADISLWHGHQPGAAFKLVERFALAN